MKHTKYLPLKEKEWPWIGSHRSCLLDELFMEKYTVDGHERKLKRQREAKEDIKLRKQRRLVQSRRNQLALKNAAVARRNQKQNLVLQNALEGLRTNRRRNVNRDLFKAPSLQSEEIRASDFNLVTIEEDKEESHNYSEKYSRLSYDDEDEHESEYKEETPDEAELTPEESSHPLSQMEPSSYDLYSSLNNDDIDIEIDSATQLYMSEHNTDREINQKPKHELLKKLYHMSKWRMRETKKESLIANLLREDVMEKSEREQIKTQREIQMQKEAKENNLARIEIEAIEFGWILNDKEGVEFLQGLAESETIDIFSLRIIRIIITFLWKHYRRFLCWAILYPYRVFLVLYILYVTWIHRKKQEEEEIWGDYYIANICMIILSIIFLTYFTMLEGFHLWYHGLHFFKSFWKTVSLISIALGYTTVIADLCDLPERDFVPLSSISLLLFYFRLIYFAKFHKTTAYLSKMIVEITIDMRYFLLVLLMSVVAFANVFYIISDREERFTGETILNAFIYSYRTALGDFETDGFEQPHRNLVFVLWLTSTWLTLIILLNLLIAIMGDTFSKIQETAESNSFQELAEIMAENEVFVNRAALFGKNKYIFVINGEKAEVRDESWEGNINFLKKEITKAAEKQRYVVKKIQSDLKFTIRNKIDSHNTKIQTHIDNRVNMLDSTVSKVEMNAKYHKDIYEAIMKLHE